MKLPALRIGELLASIPIIQGGMGIGVSGANLASAVANAGGIGTISGVQIGYNEPDFQCNTMEANLRALRKAIKTAKEKSKKGIIAINFLTAMNNYDENVKVAIEEDVDMIVSGAGLPTQLPSLKGKSRVKLVPIVSSPKAASVISKLWEKRCNFVPDMVIVEGPEAGGHLGFKEDMIETTNKADTKETLKEIIKVMKPYEEKHKKTIPVIAAGGIYTGKDIAEYMSIGADGVQMATRFVTTFECDADIKFKEAYLNANEEDIIIIKSPVGLPGRALKNKFIQDISMQGDIIKNCYNCLKTCNPKTTPYCISKALINAVKGNVDEGLIFIGSNGYRNDKIVSTDELIKGLVEEAENFM